MDSKARPRRRQRSVDLPDHRCPAWAARLESGSIAYRVIGTTAESLEISVRHVSSAAPFLRGLTLAGTATSPERLRFLVSQGCLLVLVFLY